MTFTEDELLHAAELIAQADALIVAAGAGMGVDSGLPDFRGSEGFWKAYPALAQSNMSFTRVASPRTFEEDPTLAWGFYGHRLKLYRDIVPHEGFQILLRWGKQMHNGVAAFTSNVDGQFQKAGFDPELIHECHGSIHHLQCLNACCDDIWSADGFYPDVDEIQCRLLNPLPTCPRCGGLARPNVLMFGDGGWIERRELDQSKKLGEWLIRAERPVVVELGAGTAIPSVRHFSQEVVHAYGGRLIRINPRESSVMTRLDVGLAAGSLEALRAIDAADCS